LTYLFVGNHYYIMPKRFSAKGILPSLASIAVKVIRVARRTEKLRPTSAQAQPKKLQMRGHSDAARACQIFSLYNLRLIYQPKARSAWSASRP
jgi:hypothetical protein